MLVKGPLETHICVIGLSHICVGSGLLTALHQDITWLVTNSFMWYYLLIYACYGSDNDDNVHFKYVKMMVVKPDAEYVINMYYYFPESRTLGRVKTYANQKLSGPT